MIFILVVSLIWGLFLSLFVLSPLLSKNKQLISHSISFKTPDYTHLLQKKEDLFAKLTGRNCTFPDIKAMTESQALNELYEVCAQLEAVGISWKPSYVKTSKESGNSNISSLLFVLVFLSVFFFANMKLSKAFANVPLPANVVIPPANQLGNNNYWLPSVNQFILVPQQGALQVYYVGMFSNSAHASEANILLPFPNNISNINIISKNSPKILTNNSHEVILKMPLLEDVNQIQAEFTLQASTGVAAWKKNSLSNLPGVVIFMMPQYDGILRDLTNKISPIMNVWPARIVNFPVDFKSFLSNDVLNSSNSLESELTKQFVRVGSSTANFPEFQVVGLVPSRFFIYLLCLFFVCFFVAALAITFFKNRS